MYPSFWTVIKFKVVFSNYPQLEKLVRDRKVARKKSPVWKEPSQTIFHSISLSRNLLLPLSGSPLDKPIPVGFVLQLARKQISRDYSFLVLEHRRLVQLYRMIKNTQYLIYIQPSLERGGARCSRGSFRWLY